MCDQDVYMSLQLRMMRVSASTGFDSSLTEEEEEEEDVSGV